MQPIKPGTPGRTPVLFGKCTGFFYERYTTQHTEPTALRPIRRTKPHAYGHFVSQLGLEPKLCWTETPKLIESGALRLIKPPLTELPPQSELVAQQINPHFTQRGSKNSYTVRPAVVAILKPHQQKDKRSMHDEVGSNPGQDSEGQYPVREVWNYRGQHHTCEHECMTNDKHNSTASPLKEWTCQRARQTCQGVR